MFKNAKLVSINTNPDDYFKNEHKRGDASFPVSSSMLKQFGHCPERWFSGYNPPETDAKDFGSLLDCCLLTPKQLDGRYIKRPAFYLTDGMECPVCKTVTDSKSCSKCKVPRVQVRIEKEWSGNASECQKWSSEAKAKGMNVITDDQLADTISAMGRMNADQIIKSFIDASEKQAYLSAQWHDEDTGLIMPVRCMVDLVPDAASEFGKCLADVKTTRTAAVMAWQRDCFKMGYYIQAALYIDVWTAAFPEQDRNTFCFILVENYAPWQTGKRMLSQEFLDLGRAEYKRLIKNYCACLKSNRWPSYDDTDEAVQGWSLVEAEPFMADRQAFAPKYDFDEEETETTTEDDQGTIP